ncbi:MAG: leucine-rich repeat domain-containing protein, partial [Clostridia bacterium]|nr:leucine-rich repeat domain-containing protein [Clostridia bacterium]
MLKYDKGNNVWWEYNKGQLIIGGQGAIPDYDDSNRPTYEADVEDLNLSKITSVEIKDGNVTKIGANMFNGCTNLLLVRIDDSVTEIGENAFKDCNINNLYFNGSADTWAGITFGNQYSNPFATTVGSQLNVYFDDDKQPATELHIWATCDIKSYAFYNWSFVTKIEISSGGDISIGKSAFEKCGKIEGLPQLDVYLFIEGDNRFVPWAENIFTNSNVRKVYVPRDKLELYKESGWKSLSTKADQGDKIQPYYRIVYIGNNGLDEGREEIVFDISQYSIRTYGEMTNYIKIPDYDNVVQFMWWADKDGNKQTAIDTTEFRTHLYAVWGNWLDGGQKVWWSFDFSVFDPDSTKVKLLIIGGDKTGKMNDFDQQS